MIRVCLKRFRGNDDVIIEYDTADNYVVKNDFLLIASKKINIAAFLISEIKFVELVLEDEKLEDENGAISSSSST